MRSKTYPLRCSLLYIFILTLVLFPASAFSATIHVPTDQPTIQAGIDAAFAGDTVLVADGTYTGEGNKNLDFKGKAITVQSENGPENTIIDCEVSGRAFYFRSGEAEDSVVSGFTIMNGQISQGGAFRCSLSSPSINNCIIRANGANYGGAFHLSNSSPSINNCIIRANTAYYGGAFYLSHSTPTITNCIINGNSAHGFYGFHCSPTLVSCTISENGGRGIYIAEGLGSIWTITNSILWKNGYEEDEIYVRSGVPDFVVTHSTVRGGWPGEGNIELNPSFVDTANDDYRLKNYSPCIGAGTPMGAPNTDIEGNPRPNPAGSNPDMGAHENSRATRAIPPLNIFAIEVGNRWNYEGTKQGNPYTVEREIIRLDQTAFSPDTYEFEIKENGLVQLHEWYEKRPNEIRIWDGGGYRFSAGLLAVWSPMQVGDHRESSANVVGFPGASVSLTVDVLSRGPLALAFDTLEAYELRYQSVTSGPGGTFSETFRWWMVPYIGVVKDQRANSLVELALFAIASGTITQATDADSDGLKDYQELIIYETSMVDADTDSDGMPDGWEVTYGLDPSDDKDADGDIDQDGYTNLEEYQKDTDPNDPKSHPSRAMPWIPLLLLDD